MREGVGESKAEREGDTGKGVVTTMDVGKGTQGHGVLDHQMLPISSAQHVQAFGDWLFSPPFT